jgi:dipeptide transport system substrate-binding protein
MSRTQSAVVAFGLSMLLWLPASYGAKTFVYCAEGSPTTFGPQFSVESVSANNIRQMFESLVEFKRGETDILPALAKSWEVSKDGLTYTFHLRNDVNFHKTEGFTPTRKFNADDVIFSFDRMRLKDHPYHMVGGGKYEYFESMEFANLIKEVQKVDDYTVKFVLSHPEAPFLADMAMPFTSILSKEYADQLLKKGTPEKLDVDPVGTGPFIFVRYDKDQTVRYKANPEYWGTKAKIDNLIFSITPDPSVRFQKLKSGECHFVSLPGLPDLAAIKADPNLNLLELPGLNTGYLGMNVQKKPLDNVLVRQAINHALNRKAYIDAVYLGHAIPSVGPLPPKQWGFTKNLKQYDYNPEKAKALLKQAGHENGFTIEMLALPVSRPYNPNGKRLAEMMQSDLAKVGIKVNVVSYDFGVFVSKTRAGEHVLVQAGWNSDNGDPDNFLHGLLSCSAIEGGANKSRWCDKKYDALVNQAKRVTSQKERTKLYAQAQAIMADQAVWVPLAHGVVYRAVSKKVTGYKFDAFGYDFLDSVDLK